MATSLSILSLNCYDSPLSFNTNIRFSEIAKALASLCPDLILLQEIISTKNKLALTQTLSKFGYKGFPKLSPKSKTGGLYIFTKEKFVYEGFIKYKDQGPILPLTIYDRYLGKGYQRGTLIKDGVEIHVLNTHIIANYNNNAANIMAQNNQVQEIINKLIQVPKDYKIILSGDLNFEFTNSNYKNLVTSLKLYDPLAKSDLITSCVTNLNKTAGLERIIAKTTITKNSKLDFTLLKGFDSKHITQEVVFSEPVKIGDSLIHLSDHFGLLTKINYIE